MPAEQIEFITTAQLRRAEARIQFLESELNRLKTGGEYVETPSPAGPGSSGDGSMAGDRTLQESEERYRQLANAIPQVVYIAGPDGKT